MTGWWNRVTALFKKPAPPINKTSCPHCTQAPEPHKLDYPKEKDILRVFVVEGCTICNACEAECPEVFKLDESKPVSIMTAEFTPDAESYFKSHRDKIEAAAHGCCVQVIGIEYTDGSFSPMGTHRGKVEHVAPSSPELPPLNTERD